jgi:sigma-B regulation protein RsbU (phosphoserine phosphatase)
MVEDFPIGRFVTMIYAVLDPERKTLTFASAGHLPPLLVDGEDTRFLPSERGMPLGLGFGDFSETKVSIPPGARLVFYSDGITEASDPAGAEYGAERLQEHAQRADACSESIVSDVRSFANGAALRDDATVIFVRALE